MKNSRTLALLCAIFAVSTPLIADNLLDVVAEAENTIIQKYPVETSIAHKLAMKELEEIVFSDKTDEEKIAAIRAKYPAASPILPIQSESAQATNPAQLIYRPRLQWSIHSIEIAYDVDSSTNILLSIENLYQEEERKNRDNSTGGSKTQTSSKESKTQDETSAGGNIQTPSSLTLNPLKWLQARAGYQWIKTDNSSKDTTNTSSSQWNERAQRALSNLYEEKVSILQNTNIKNCHLTFSVSFKNNTDSVLLYAPQDVRIPIYAGNEHLTDAVPDTSLRTVRIYSNASSDQLFRAELNTTSALKLIAYMRSHEPQIRLDRGQIQIVSEDGKVKNAVQETLQVQTVPFRCRDFELRIRKNYQGKQTTVIDAMRAVNAVFEKAPFEFNQNGECVSLVGVPLVKNGSNDWNINQIPIIGINGNFTSAVIPATQLNRPLSENGLLIDVVDIFDRDTWDNASSQLQSYMIQPLRIAAESGNAKAQNRLGLCYHEGKGVSKNVYEAARWYRMAADQGMVFAQFNLGWLYYDNENYTEAVPWLRKSAEQGVSSAQFWLATCYENGYGVSKSIDEAGRWFWEAANQDNKNAQANLGRLYYQHKEYSEAVFWFRKAADQGDQYAQNFLGLCYDNGYGVNKNIEEATKWYRKAAEQGLAVAQSNLGYLYYVNKNYSEAVPWLRKAAEQGDDDSQNFLGLCYNNGYGVTKDTSEAAKWYRKAAEQGLDAAQCNLGLLYYGNENYTEAVPWLRKAADQGNQYAQNYLGLCYDNGYGVRKDASEAVFWFRKAVEQGYVAAQYNLGNCYYKNEKYDEAVPWMRMAAENGVAIAQTNLGSCYILGRGVRKDGSEAVKWFRKAADQGDVSAQCWLGICYRYGDGVREDKTEAVKWYRKAADQGNETAIKALKDLGY